MDACKFSFDIGPVWNGFAHGSTWNGFDNVAVTKETLDKMIEWFLADAKKTGSGKDDAVGSFRELTPMNNGLYSLGWGFATQIVDSAAWDVCCKWVGRIGLGFHPDTRGKDYSPKMSDKEITEYDADMDALFAGGGDPYGLAIKAMEEQGLT